MKKPECLCDNTKGGHAIDCDLAPKDCYCLTHGFHTTNPKEQCPKCRAEAPNDNLLKAKEKIADLIDEEMAKCQKGECFINEIFCVIDDLLKAQKEENENESFKKGYKEGFKAGLEKIG